MITGLVQLMGCIGAIVGGAPVAILSAQYGWRPTLTWAAVIGVGIMALFWLIIRDHPKGCEIEKAKKTDVSEIQRLKSVCRKDQTWWVGLTGFASWSPILIFAALWGTPFFQQVYSINAAEASEMVMWIWIGVAVGSPLMGWC